MLLDKLREYSHRLPEMAPPGYQETPIRWLVDLDGGGRFLGFVSTTAGESGKQDRGRRYKAPHVLRTSAIKAKLLADRADYALGFYHQRAAAPQKKRVAECHQAFLALVTDCARETQEPAVVAVQRFLEGLELEKLTLPQDLAPSDVFTFRVDNTLPIHLEEVQAFWERSQARGGTMGQCLVCGQQRPVLERHPLMVKGIPGGQPSGTAIVSANAPAFESYGLSASLIAPVCQGCAERYAKGANALISAQENRLYLGPAVYLFWTRQPSAFNPATMLSDPRPEDVKALLESAFRGRQPPPPDENAFYATALSASGGRVVVREWLETTVGEAQRHLARYFARQRIVDWDGTEGSPIGLYALAASTVADARELPPTTPRVLLRNALGGGPLPMWLLFQAVRRNRAEQRLTRPRAALIKMVWLSNRDALKEDNMVQLDMDSRDPAYLCGRLLAVVESAQRAALPGLEDTVTDRFYGTASSAPASVFPRLLRGVRPHLAKLRRDRPSACHALEARLEEIQSGLKAFPNVLTLEEQGLFALGFYHQRAADRAAAAAHRKAETGPPQAEEEKE